jgi:hypothetical protein
MHADCMYARAQTSPTSSARPQTMHAWMSGIFYLGRNRTLAPEMSHRHIQGTCMQSIGKQSFDQYESRKLAHHIFHSVLTAIRAHDPSMAADQSPARIVALAACAQPSSTRSKYRSIELSSSPPSTLHAIFWALKKAGGIILPTFFLYSGAVCFLGNIINCT